MRHRADQGQQPGTGQARGFGLVEPDQVAGRAQIEIDRPRVVAGQRDRLHRLAAIAAGEARDGRSRWRAAHGPRLCPGVSRHPGGVQFRAGFQRCSSSALLTTLTLDSAIAAPAITGLSSPNAASGMPTTL